MSPITRYCQTMSNVPSLITKCQTHLPTHAMPTPQLQQNEAPINCTITLYAAWKNSVHTDDAAHSRREKAEDGLKGRHWQGNNSLNAKEETWNGWFEVLRVEPMCNRRPFSFQDFVLCVIGCTIDGFKLQHVTLLGHRNIKSCRKKVPIEIVYYRLVQLILFRNAEIVWSFVLWYLFGQSCFKVHSNADKRYIETSLWLCRHHVV